ncbi:MAG: 2-oxoacid:ferredoxin oxidoreductase subunit beta [Bacteriovoracaceae bacterium]
MSEMPVYAKKDFVSDQEVKWCPGCGDYSILAAIQMVMPKIGKKKEDIVFVSGIGCSSRFPYYMSTYGMHTIHGRAPAIATGLKTTNPNLDVWVITGDGDSMSIGGNHLIHAIRRNVDLKIVIFNNEIYGLTKGQYSPTSNTGLVTKSTPYGSVDRAFMPGSLVTGAESTFFARTIDTDIKHMQEVFMKAAQHKGTAVVEVLQNCVIFHDGVHDNLSDKEKKDETTLKLEHGKPLIFGKDKNKGIRIVGMSPEVVTIGENGVTEKDIFVHNENLMDPTYSFMLSRFSHPAFPVPMGTFRSVASTIYDQEVQNQVNAVTAKKGKGDMKALLMSGETWEVK